MSFDKISSSHKQALDNGFQKPQRMELRPAIVLIALAGSSIALFAVAYWRL